MGIEYDRIPDSIDHRIDRGAERSESIHHISGMRHGTIIAVGSGKQGKSCSLHSLLAITQPDRGKYLLDRSDFDHSVFPGYGKVSEPDDVPVDSIAVVEDANRFFHSRGSGKDATLQKWLGVISHKDIVVCLTTQSLADTDLDFLRSQDTIIMHKWMHEEDLGFERREFRDSQCVANEWISIASARYPGIDRRAWCFFPRFNECVAIPEVGWWSYGCSHMLRGVRVCR